MGERIIVKTDFFRPILVLYAESVAQQYVFDVPQIQALGDSSANAVQMFVKLARKSTQSND